MTAPTETPNPEKPAGTIGEKLATRTMTAIRLDPRIPIAKVLWLIGRTIVGMLVAGAGVWMLVECFALLRETKNLSLPLFISGIAFIVVGAVTASGTIIVRAIMSLREPGHVVRSLITGGTAGAED